MWIKARYYTEGVFPRLLRDIEAALKPFPGFKQELFDKLYDFFHRYFSPSGSIYFRHTAAHKNIYDGATPKRTIGMTDPLIWTALMKSR